MAAISFEDVVAQGVACCFCLCSFDMGVAGRSLHASMQAYLFDGLVTTQLRGTLYEHNANAYRFLLLQKASVAHVCSMCRARRCKAGLALSTPLVAQSRLVGRTFPTRKKSLLFNLPTEQPHSHCRLQQSIAS